MKFSPSIFFFAASVSPAFLTSASADVIYVGLDNAPFTQLSTAVAMAPSDSVLIVEQGTYTGFTISNKSLTIMPRRQGVEISINGQVNVQNLSSDKRVILVDLHVDSNSTTASAALSIEDCLGVVQVQDCEFSTAFSAGAIISDSDQVSFRSSKIQCGVGNFGITPPGIEVTASNLSLYETEVAAGDGRFAFNGLPGGTGIQVSGGSRVYAAGGHFNGGDGGDGHSGLSNGSGGAGGNAVDCQAPNIMEILECQLTGGAPGSGGLGSGAQGTQGGTFTLIPGEKREARVLRNAILDTKPIVIEYRGTPGDAIEYAYDMDPTLAFVPGEIGPSWVTSSTGSGYTSQGIVPATGILSWPIVITDLPTDAHADFTIQVRATAAGGIFNSSISSLELFDQCTGSVPIGETYCSAVPNSTGSAANLEAYGSDCAASQDLYLFASGVPSGQAGIFLSARGQGFVSQPGGSTGNLCLGGPAGIGRHNRPGEVSVANVNGPDGYFHSLSVDVTHLPIVTGGTTTAMANETWTFQLWYRDQGTSNFSDAIQLRFR